MRINLNRDYISYISFCFFVFFVFFDFTNLIKPSFLGVVNKTLYLLFFVFFLFQINSRFIIKKWVVPSLVILFFYCYLYTVKTIYHGNSIVGNIVSGSIVYFLLYFSFVLIINKWSIRRILKPFLFSSIFIVFLSLLNYIGFDFPLYLADEEELDMSLNLRESNSLVARGVFLNQNTFSILLLVNVIISTIYLSFLRKKSYIIVFFIFVSLVMLVLTMSRAALLATFIFYFLFQLKTIKNIRGIVLLFLFSVFCLIVLYYFYEYIDLIVNRSLESGSSGRTEIWKNALESFKDNFLFGVGNYKYIGVSGREFSAHNYYVHKLASDGAFSSVFLFLFLFFSLSKAFKVYFSEVMGCKVLISISLIAILVHQTFEAQMLSPLQPLTLLFLFLTAYIWSIKNNKCNDPLISCSGIMTKGKYDEYRDDRRNQTLDSKA